VLQNQRGIAEYLDYVNSLSGYTTKLNRSSSSGIAISYKK
jgi:caffeoyl-CoA O-methyltransferase